MEAKWLSVQSFQSNQEIIAAINTVSIYIKLKQQGIATVKAIEEIHKAKDDIKRFLSEFDKNVIAY